MYIISALSSERTITKMTLSVIILTFFVISETALFFSYSQNTKKLLTMQVTLANERNSQSDLSAFRALLSETCYVIIYC